MIGVAARRFGLRPFLSFDGGPYASYRDVHEMSRAVGGGLRELGVKRGDRVLIMLPNRLEFVLTWFGANLIGAVQVPVNIDYTGDWLEHIANTAEAGLIVIHSSLLPVLDASRERLPRLEHVVVVDSPPRAPNGTTAVPFERLLRGTPGDFDEVRISDLAAIHFTSGTTGKSKGTMMTHAQQHLLASQNQALVDLTSTDVFLNHMPLFHVNAQATAVYAAMLVGARVDLRRRFSASAWLEEVRSSGATITTTLGGMMQFILSQPETADDARNDLRVVWAVPAPVDDSKVFARRFGIERIATTYGNTEIGAVVDPRDRTLPLGSCGRVDQRWYELKLVDPETDEPVPVGEVGEVIVRPRLPWILTQGYFGMPERTAETFRNLWFHTGDSLREDERGYLYFVDRIKDRIRTKGENIAAADLEELIGRHPAIAECAVVGIRSAVTHEDDVKVSAVLKPGMELTPQELLVWCQDRLPAFAVPRYVEYLPELPKTPTAKVRREMLRAAGVTGSTFDGGPSRRGRSRAGV